MNSVVLHKMLIYKRLAPLNNGSAQRVPAWQPYSFVIEGACTRVNFFTISSVGKRETDTSPFLCELVDSIVSDLKRRKVAV